MKPPFAFRDIIEDEIALQDPETYKGVGFMVEDSLTRYQSKGVRISDSGSCSLELWAKLNGLHTLPVDPQHMLFRMNLGSVVGAMMGCIFASAMRRKGIAVEAEETVSYEGVEGHLDLALPTYEHIYEIKSNYGTKIFQPGDYQIKQTGLYHKAKGDGWTSSIVVAQPALGTGRNRIHEYEMNDPEYLANAEAESLRLRTIASALTPPQPDVSETEKFRCKSCQYAACARNENPMLQKAVSA